MTNAKLRLDETALEAARVALSAELREYALPSADDYPDWHPEICTRAADMLDALRSASTSGEAGEPLDKLVRNAGDQWMAGLLKAHLREHWLASIVCDHEAKTDTAICSCSQWRDEPHPSVGAAVDAWIDHVFAALLPPLPEQGIAAPEGEGVREALKNLIHAYVSLLESGRDIIVRHGGTCDPVDVMERGDPNLIEAKSALASQPPASKPGPAGEVVLAEWEDPRTQLVYEMLCDNVQPPPEEHWEGFLARRIVAALSQAPALTQPVADLDERADELWQALLVHMQVDEPFVDTYHDKVAALAIIRAALAPTITENVTVAPSAPAQGGWKMVPVQPTYEMLNAAIDVDSFKLGDISPIGFRITPQMLFEKCYAAMLAASPTPEPIQPEGKGE